MKAVEKAKLKAGKNKPTPVITKKTMFEKTEKWLLNNQKLLFIITTVLFVILSFLMFSLRISEGGDDSTYIQAGYNYSKKFFSYYFTFNAPLYPMFLGIIISIFGINVFFLKLISLIFSYFHIFFIYKALKNRIPQLILFPVLLLVSTNAYFLIFASQTYNEAFFLFFQAVFIYYFLKLEDNITKNGNSLKTNYKAWIVIGILIFVLSMTKNVAIIIIPGIILYYLLNKRFLNILFLIGSFLLIKLPFELIKSLVWGNLSQYKSQSSYVMQVNPYDKSKGLETIGGFFMRLIQNCQVYLSDVLMQILGFKKEYTNIESPLLAFILILVIIAGIILIIRSKNKALQFLMFYGASIIGASFFVLQKMWSQHRIILIEVPVLLIVVFFVLYKLFNRKYFLRLQFVYFLFIMVLVFSGLILTTKKINKNLPTIIHNISGDSYYGYTPDWKNYLLMSDWCAHNLKETDKVACRKPSVSFLFTRSEKFYGVFEVKTTNPDSALAFFKNNNITHVLLSSLRLNPAMPTMNIYNSLQRMVYPIAVKYPYKIQFVNQFGVDEPSYLYKINY
jgi:hypothetical protein